MTKLTAAELAAESVELLPDRDTLFSLSFTKVNWAEVYASNTSTAMNVFTIHSEANSAALQSVTTIQK
jgi:hypothetical protein